jgi:hypothetical protein
MYVQSKVLHLSLFVAMLLPPITASAASDEAVQIKDGIRAQIKEQEPAGEAQRLKNAGESQRLRHRLSETVTEEAERSRLEKREHLRDAEQVQSQVQDPSLEQSGDEDRLTEQDKQQDRDRIRDQDRLMDESHTNDPALSGEQSEETGRRFDPYQFDDHSAGQGFNTDGSMFQKRGGGSVKGAGATSTGSRSGDGGGRGAGKR